MRRSIHAMQNTAWATCSKQMTCRCAMLQQARAPNDTAYDAPLPDGCMYVCMHSGQAVLHRACACELCSAGHSLMRSSSDMALSPSCRMLMLLSS